MNVTVRPRAALLRLAFASRRLAARSDCRRATAWRSASKRNLPMAIDAGSLIGPPLRTIAIVGSA